MYVPHHHYIVVVKTEYNNFENLIELADTWRRSLTSTYYKVKLIAGSMCNIVTQSKCAETCYICGAKSSDMNRTGISKFIPDYETYKYGLSTLYC